MILVAICLLATYVVLFLVGITMLARAAVHAPSGFEDAEGFHLLSPVQELGSKQPPSADLPASVRASLRAC